MNTKIRKIPDILFKQVDNSPLVLFRVAFGFLIFVESVGAIFTGWVHRVMIDPDFTFAFIGFEWLQPLPGNGMYLYYALMGIFGLMVMIGLFYRLSISMFTLMWWGVYLMQKSSYNNHYYLLILLCLLMIVVPANAYLSLDVRRKPHLKSLSCPQWCIWIFIIQIGIVFTYAAVAKLYPGWMQGDFIRLSFSAKRSLPLIGPLLSHEWLIWMVVYGGFLYDLLVTPALIWSKTRWIAVAASVVFHLFNSYVFQIGIFPYLMLAMLVFFFPGEQVREVFLKSKKPWLGEQHNRNFLTNKWILVLGCFYFLLQIYLPLRHHLYPGNVHWTEEGHRMSWHMMLRSKSGTAVFHIVDAHSNQEWEVRPISHMSPKQANRLATHPDMIWQFSQKLKREYGEKGYPDVQVFVIANAKLNNGPFRELVDPTVDLGKEDWHRFQHNQWIRLYDHQ